MDRVEAFKLTNPTKYNFLFERLLVEHLKRSLRAASLVGQSAPPEFLQLVTYVAFNHHQKILRLDTVRAYMLGGHYFVEVKSLETLSNLPIVLTCGNVDKPRAQDEITYLHPPAYNLWEI